MNFGGIQTATGGRASFSSRHGELPGAGGRAAGSVSWKAGKKDRVWGWGMKGGRWDAPGETPDAAFIGDEEVSARPGEGRD